MSYPESITLSAENQGFVIEKPELRPEKASIELRSYSKKDITEISCPYCGSSHIHQNRIYTRTIKGVPLNPHYDTFIKADVRSFECQGCRHVFTEEVPFAYPGTRITENMAAWIKEMLTFSSVSAISRMLHVDWNTVKGIHKELVKSTLRERRQRQIRENYRPRYLGVDEFAIHKGHSYATVVMDLETGEVLWAGKDRTIESFGRFFDEIEPELLEQVEAVAMDMNASYNRVFRQRMPGVRIVYDRYHMEANYSRDVMGAVRLEAARECRMRSYDEDLSREEQMMLKAEYSMIKKSRWRLLRKDLGEMDEDGSWTCSDSCLQEILDRHQDIALCYAMKQELSSLYSISDPDEAEKRWKAWFDAASASGIPALERFARNKRERLPGLIAYASFPITTSRVEGTNNKIKVLKRIAYGFRDDDYFFSLIRYSTIPKSSSFPSKF